MCVCVCVCVCVKALLKSIGVHGFMVIYQGFPTRMVYPYDISCLRYTILVGNPCYNVMSVINVVTFYLVTFSDSTNKFLPGDNKYLFN